VTGIVPVFMKAKVTVMPKQSVLDPQGVAVRGALEHLGLSGLGTVRVGKVIEIEIEGVAGGASAALEEKLHAACHELLSNPVIEDYRLELEG
jgi:phosphoribosylformylglycinamidine synthase PurS subunit